LYCSVLQLVVRPYAVVPTLASLSLRLIVGPSAFSDPLTSALGSVSFWDAIPQRPPPIVSVWCRTPALGCPHRRGPPYRDTHLSIVVVSCRTSTLGSPRRCGLPYRGVRLSSSILGYPRSRGLPASVFSSLCRRGVACFSVGLPTSLWVALLRCSLCRGVGGEQGSEADVLVTTGKNRE